MATYEDKAKLPVSEKLLLAHVEPSEQLTLFEQVPFTDIYKRSVDFYILKVKQGDTTLTEASTSSLSSGEWFFDFTNKELFVRMTDDSNPENNFISVFYRLFFANKPVTKTHDLTTTGNLVEYESRIINIGNFKQKLDDEATGIALETSSSFTLHNNDGFFEDIYDTIFWENKRLAIYSLIDDLESDKAQLLFEGIIDEKAYTGQRIRFKAKDNVFKLREPLPLPLFTSADGVSDDDIGTPKRRLYGEVEGLRLVGQDKTLEGFTLTGTMSATVGSATLTGVGTSFLSELAPDDTLKFELPLTTVEIKVESIESDTSATMSENFENSFNAISGSNLPEIPFRGKNRIWHIAGHKLRNPQATVLAGIQGNRFTVTDVNDLDDFEAGDLIRVDSEENFIKRISGNQVVLETNLGTGTPSGGETLQKIPVRNVFFTGEVFKGFELFVDRDWSLTNGTSDSFITFNNLAEFNITRPRLLGGSIDFINNSRVVTTTNLDFKAEGLRPRDWIKVGLSDDATHQVWYEILQIDSETQLQIRVPFAGTTQTATATERKNVEYFSDDALITIRTLGRENAAGNWVKTASDAVRDILEDIGLSSDLNTSSFDEADCEAPFKLSLALPLEPGDDPPEAKKVITLINDTVFGALFNDTDFKFTYNILTAKKPTTQPIKDDDVETRTTFRVQSKPQIFRKVTSRFRHFDADRFNGQTGSQIFEFESDFVKRLIETTAEKVLDVYLFDQADVKIITQRFAFFKSLSNSRVKVKGGLQFSLNNLGDKIFIDFERLYKRFGQKSKQKIVLISGVTRTGKDTTLETIDLGNIFNRVGAITENTNVAFTSATDDEKIFAGYIVDNSTALPDNSDEEAKGINLIG